MPKKLSILGNNKRRNWIVFCFDFFKLGAVRRSNFQILAKSITDNFRALSQPDAWSRVFSKKFIPASTMNWKLVSKYSFPFGVSPCSLSVSPRVYFPGDCNKPKQIYRFYWSLIFAVPAYCPQRLSRLPCFVEGLKLKLQLREIFP